MDHLELAIEYADEERVEEILPSIGGKELNRLFNSKAGTRFTLLDKADYMTTTDTDPIASKRIVKLLIDRSALRASQIINKRPPLAPRNKKRNSTIKNKGIAQSRTRTSKT
jgi:hypothetical protein